MPVYTLIHTHEKLEFIQPPEEDPPFGSIGKLVYQDPFSAIKAAKKFVDYMVYGCGFSRKPIRIYEVYADWISETIEGQKLTIEEVKELEEYYGKGKMISSPEDVESAQSALNEPEDTGRYLTVKAKVGKLIKTV